MTTEALFNIINKIPNCKLLIERRPSDWGQPLMHVGTSKTLGVRWPDALFGEVFYKDVCAFRHTYIPEDNDWDKAYETISEQILRSMIEYGIVTSYMKRQPPQP